MKKLIFLLLFISFRAGAQDFKFPVFITDSLENYIKTGMKDWQIPGLAVAIVKDGKVVFMKGYGVREVGKNEPVDENTLFMIGSNTKAFTATALAMLEHQKKLSLDDKVTRWLPDFRLHDALASREVTVRDLLCHRLGFETFQGDFTYWTSKLTRAEVVQKMGLITPLFSFRSHYGYCNAAFVAAGEVIPGVTGKKWEDYIRENILQPLNMNRTLMLARDLPAASNAARPYTLYNDKLVELPYAMIDNLSAAGSISSSVSDMCHWLIAQLDEGRWNGKQVIAAEAVQATHDPNTVVGRSFSRFTPTHFQLYGLGFGLTDYNGLLAVRHTGGVDGFLSSVELYPEKKLGVIVLTNSDQNNFFAALGREIVDAMLALPYRGYSQLNLEGFRKGKAEEKKQLDSLHSLAAKKNNPALELKRYAGSYRNPVYGDISIKLENNQLNIYFSNHPGLVARLDLLKDNTFLCTYSNIVFGVKESTFQTEGQSVKGLTLKLADFVEFTPYEFTKVN